mmetsp:Transcript_28405/g.31565  ORF Transcript_28405/g.31565 Transcript_28405/m.31565 type:complete len:254 (+) Transcript_28405:53-814(+)
MEAGTPRPDSLIRINVGGVRYVTTKSTLDSKGENFFTRMIDNHKSGKMHTPMDEKGYWFVDRNGKAFEAVLEFLRTGEIFYPSTCTKEQVLREFDFYGIDVPPIEEVNHPTDFLTEILDLKSKHVPKSVQDFLDDHWATIFEFMKNQVVVGIDYFSFSFMERNNRGEWFLRIASKNIITRNYGRDFPNQLCQVLREHYGFLTTMTTSANTSFIITIYFKPSSTAERMFLFFDKNAQLRPVGGLDKKEKWRVAL